MNQKGFANIVLIVLVVILVGGTVGYFVVTRDLEQAAQPTTPLPTTPPPTTQSPTPQVPTPTSADETAGWEIYRNEKYGFEIKYPSSDKFTRYGIYDFPIHPEDDKTNVSYESLSLTDKFGRGLVAVQYSSGGEDGMPSTGALSVGIFENTNRISLKDWIAQNIHHPFLEYARENKIVKEDKIAGYDALIFGWYPYNTFQKLQEEAYAEWVRSGGLGSSRPVPSAVIFLISGDKQKIASFHSYPYIETWDKIISTFRFTQ